MKGAVRSPAVAGSFYPGSEQALKDEVAAYLSAVSKPEVEGRLLALISPHAGYIYSGRVAAHGYSLLRELEFELVVVAAPSHRDPISGSTVYEGDAYATPLGIVQIDKDVSQSLTDACDSVVFSTAGHRSEHSLEVQLPFLQEALSEPFTLVPIVMGDQTPGTLEELARGLGTAVKGKKALLVASSDLSHYHSADRAKALDRVVINYVENLDPDGLYRAVMSSECEACGVYPIVAIMKAAQAEGAGVAHVLCYGNSGDTTGDYSEVVGYLSAAFTGV